MEDYNFSNPDPGTFVPVRCPNCGAALSPGTGVCPACGLDLTESSCSRSRPDRFRPLGTWSVIFGIPGFVLGPVLSVLGLVKSGDRSTRTRCVLGLLTFVLSVIVQLVLLLTT